jgi:hypothetical protein
VLLIFDNLVEPTKGVHGVVVTHLLAKEELRVRFSLEELFMWKGKPIGDGTPFEAERALKPCEFNSRSFRLVLDECAIGRAAKVLDFQSGQVGSTPTWHSV